MKMRQRQTGMSLPGMLAIGIMVGFFVMCGIRMAPSYFEYLTVKDIVTKVAAEFEPTTDTIADIRRRIASTFNTNQVYGLKPGDVEIFRKEGRTYINANYEARIPVMGRIDAVIRFDDLEMEAGRAPAP